MKFFVFVASHDGTILYINNEGGAFINYGNDIIFPANIFELFSVQSKKEIDDRIRLAKKSKEKKINLFPVNVVFGHDNFEAKLQVELIYGANNQLVILAGHLHSVKNLPDPSHYYRHLYLGFIDNLPLGVYRTGLNGKIHYVNRKFVDILGYNSAEELYNLNIEEVFVDKSHRTQLLNGISSEDKLHTVELRLYTKDRKVIWVKDSGRAIRDAEGVVVFLDGILEDITKQKENEIKIKESEAQLKELNASKDKLFSIISHDLRTPFNQFIGATELLLTKLEEYDKEMIRKFLTLLNKEAVQSYRLLENLLQWSKNQRGLIKFDPKPLNFPEFVSELLAFYEPMASTKNITLDIHIPRDIYVYADENMLSTILRNLVSNAVKFTPDGGNIAVSAVEKVDDDDLLTEYLEVSVSDTGIGIPEKNIATLFSIYSEVSGNIAYNESGTGLGLILCKDFVEKHNGKIWVESEFGKGSTFYFTIR